MTEADTDDIAAGIWKAVVPDPIDTLQNSVSSHVVSKTF